MSLIDLSQSGQHKLILRCPLCPGDVMTLTAAVESIHRQYPDKFLTDVRTDVSEIWHFNPWITPISDDDPDAITIDVSYTRQIVQSNRVPFRFLGAYTKFIGDALGIPLTLQVNRPSIYLIDKEREWSMVRHIVNNAIDSSAYENKGNRPVGINRVNNEMDTPSLPIWLVCAGSKSDYPAKQWPWEYFQEVIDRTWTQVTWVQVGSDEQGDFPHTHPKLERCINLVGKTSHRELHRLTYHASGGLGGITYLMHLAAAFDKPYICLAGGREPTTWINYPKQHYLHTIGQLSCCENWSCWKARVVPVNDGRDTPEKMCEKPASADWKVPVATCMTMIHPEEVISIIKRQIAGATLK